MNYNEYLKSKNITVTTSAKNLTKMLEAYKADSSSFAKAFKGLKVKEGDTEIEPSDFCMKVVDWKDSITEFDQTAKNTYDILVNIFKAVIDTKNTNKEIIKQKKVDDSLNVPDYTKSFEYRDVNLFETVLNCKPNKYDRELYKNFIIVR